MKPENLKNLIACLTDAACEWGVTECESSKATADLLADLLNSSKAAFDADDNIDLQPLDIVPLYDPMPLRVLAACLQFENEVWDYMCELPDPLHDEAWRLMDGLRTAAIERLPGFEPWPLD
jgi:hypothetical protein